MRDPNPVVYLENEIMYSQSFEVSDKALDPNFTIEIGKAKIQREGKHVTVVAFSKMVGFSMDAAKELAKEGLEVEVINLRSIRPLDR